MTPLEWLLFVTAPTILMVFGLEVNFLTQTKSLEEEGDSLE